MVTFFEDLFQEWYDFCGAVGALATRAWRWYWRLWS